MVLIKKNQDVTGKLAVLSRDSQYDLACACATRPDEHRRRSKEDKWIYPVSLPNGGTTFLFKTLLSNQCSNDCKYCPLRAGKSASHCSLTPEELAGTVFSYYKAHRVNGLFLSSAVAGSADNTMERINRTALLLRRMQFKGYIHLKVIPGATEAAIRQSLALANAVSLNIETAGENNFKQLTETKNYVRDIMRPIQLISRLTAKGASYSGVKQTTQFVVGASCETDKEIINYSWRLYKELSLNRIYFSAYQRGAGAPDIYGENSKFSNAELLTREHRLYQVDWLIRKYGFSADEIPLETDGNLSLKIDPKYMWAQLHPEFFPVNINKDDKFKLLRVPGFGQVMVERILELRAKGIRINSWDDLRRLGGRYYGSLLTKASAFVTF